MEKISKIQIFHYSNSWVIIVLIMVAGFAQGYPLAGATGRDGDFPDSVSDEEDKGTGGNENDAIDDNGNEKPDIGNQGDQGLIMTDPNDEDDMFNEEPKVTADGVYQMPFPLQTNLKISRPLDLDDWELLNPRPRQIPQLPYESWAESKLSMAPKLSDE